MLYQRILDYCKDNKIALSALEKECGLGNGTIKGWESSSPRVESIKKVAEKIGCTIDDLIREE